MMSIAALTSPAMPIAIATSQQLEPEQRAHPHRVADDDPPLRERRMQEDDVRHHGRAEDAGGQQHAVGPAEPRQDGADGDLAPVRPGQHGLDEVADGDDADEGRDDGFERPEAVAFEAEDDERRDRPSGCPPARAESRAAG